jgi:Ca2+-binding EF-hand superfamily protein
MKHIIVIAVFSLLVWVANPCCAADDQLFDEIDANNDGNVTVKELRGQELVIETEKDGHKEVHADEAKEAGSTSTMTFEQKRKLLEGIDQNKDGSINRKEWNRASPEGFVLWKF